MCIYRVKARKKQFSKVYYYDIINNDRKCHYAVKNG